MKYTSKYIDEILTSPSAKNGLNYITPIYQEAYNALWIMQSMGLQTDILIKWIEEYKTQILPQTTTWLLPYFEEEYGVPVNPALSIEQRRKNLLFAIRIRAPMNPDKFTYILSSMTGIDDIYIKENVAKNAFYAETSIALNKEQVKKIHNIVDKYKPAHLIYWLNVLTKVIFQNYNFFKFHQMIISAFIKNDLLLQDHNLIISAYIKNYFIYPVLFNNKRNFEGTFNFNQIDKFFPVNLIMSLYIRNKMSFSVAAIPTFTYNVTNKTSQKLSLILNNFIKEKEIISESLTLELKKRNNEKFYLSELKFNNLSVKNKCSTQVNNVFSVSVKENERLTATLTLDTMWTFGENIEHNGTRRFNAAVLKLNI